MARPKKREADPGQTMARGLALAEGRESRAQAIATLEAVENARGEPAGYSPSNFGALARATYLYEIESHGGLARAAAVAGCSPTIARVYAARVPEFGAAVREALARNRDALAAEAQRRAFGVAVDRFDRNGEAVGVAIEYADGLLSKALDRADRIIGDLPTERGSGMALDATLVQRLSPEGRRALRIVLSELAGMVPTEGDMQLEGIPSVVDTQGSSMG